MAHAVTQFLQQHGIPNWLVAAIISALPILELRAGLPVALWILKMPFWSAFFICIFANFVPVPFIMIFIEKIFIFLKKHSKFFKRIIEWIERHTAAKGKDMHEKHLVGKMIALFFFVAVPLPGMGAWTGSLLAAMTEMKLKHALPVIFVGIVAMATVVGLVCTYAPKTLSFLIG